MILESIRVREYKNIRDSGEVAIRDGVTCLVGKNESGKTSLLEALYRLNPVTTGHPETFVALRDYPPPPLRPGPGARVRHPARHRRIRAGRYGCSSGGRSPRARSAGLPAGHRISELRQRAALGIRVQRGYGRLHPFGGGVRFPARGLPGRRCGRTALREQERDEGAGSCGRNVEVACRLPPPRGHPSQSSDAASRASCTSTSTV